MARPVSAGEVEQAAAAGRSELYVPADAIITTMARERAERLGVRIVKGEPPQAAAVPPSAVGTFQGSVLAVSDVIQAAAANLKVLQVPEGVEVLPAAETYARQRGIRLETASRRAAAAAPAPAPSPAPAPAAPVRQAPPPAALGVASAAPAASAPSPAPQPVAAPAPQPAAASAPSPAPAATPRYVPGQSPTAVKTPANAPVAEPYRGPRADAAPPAMPMPTLMDGRGVPGAREQGAVLGGPSTAADAPAATASAGSATAFRTPADAPVARAFAGPASAPAAAPEAPAAPVTPPVAAPPPPPPAPAPAPAPPAAPANGATNGSATAAPPPAVRAVAPAAIDPVTIDLIENALRSIRFEMDAVLFRTAMSPGIREQHDMFPLVANPDGKMVVGQFGSFIKGFLDNWKGTVEEGDIFLLNDPYSCAGAISHLNDWLVLLPIHHQGQLVGWASMFGHLTDVGGAVPSSMPIDARTIHSEGVVIRPFKLYKRGVLDEEALQFILDQVRLPEWNRSDLMGIVAACRLAERRVKELCDRFGAGTYLGVLDALLDRTYRAVRELIQRNIAETPQSFEDYVDDDGQGYGPYKIKCTVWREGDVAVFDWSGTDPQSPAAINFYLNTEMLKMFVGVYLIMVFDPQILFNDGYYDLIDVRIPEGSLLRPRYPAALSGRTHALGRVFDVFGGALGKNTPQFMNAAGFSTSPHLMYSGYDDDGEWFQLYQIGFGGVPGRPIADGIDGHSLWPEFTNVPNEYLETYFPLVMERYECIPDSGGAGYNRGGTGIDVVYRFLADGEISIHDDRWLTYPWGVLGGKPGKRGRKYLVKPDGRRIDLPAKGDHIQVEKGDVFHYITWGGGGWGDPLDRETERVHLDLLRGLVTPRGAEDDYGVVTLEDGVTIDEEATRLLREQMRAERPPLQNFDFGPPIQEILARCKEETGMDPPSPPVFRKTAAAI